MVDRWFWQPDKLWVNEVNTTNLRSIQGIRLATAAVAIGLLAFAWATWHAVPHCAVEPCKESMGQIRAADFALGIFDSLLLFVGALMGIAVAGSIGKRLTDTDHVERKELAKAAVAKSMATAEHAAPQNVVNAQNIERVEVKEVPAVSPSKTEGMDNSRTDDERGDDAPG